MTIDKMNNKALGLLSGGLDSTLAVRVMLELGVEVTVLNFVSPFCTCTGKNAGCKSEAVKVSEEFGVPIKLIFLGQEYLDMIKNPVHGYGKHMNPCLDCRILMFKTAKQIMKEVDASFLFTGEVLGQRPMSQRRDTMNVIERESGLKGLILRPLSAKLLNTTIPEDQGIVDREKLLNISGRSRKPQMRMASEYGIEGYPCSAGGCLLTDKYFASRMRDLFQFSPAPSVDDARLLRVGRQFRISDECKLIVGRDKSENDRLMAMMGPKDYAFMLHEVKGPFAIGIGTVTSETADLISQIVIRYSGAAKDARVSVQYKKNEDTGEGIMVHVTAISEERLQGMLI